MTGNDPYLILLRVVDALESCGVPYYVSGSLSSIVHGATRSTTDADVVVQFSAVKIAKVIDLLENEFLVNKAAMLDSLRKSKSNNLIHKDSLMKVDLYPIKDDFFSHAEAKRIVKRPVPTAPQRNIFFNSCEDVTLRKLWWFSLGGHVAARQWDDAIALLKLHKTDLDGKYLAVWSEKLGVSDLLKKAQREAGWPSTTA